MTLQAVIKIVSWVPDIFMFYTMVQRDIFLSPFLLAEQIMLEVLESGGLPSNNNIDNNNHLTAKQEQQHKP